MGENRNQADPTGISSVTPESLVRDSDEPAAWLTPEGHYLGCNSAFLKLLTDTGKTLDGLSLFELWTGEIQAQKIGTAWIRAATGGIGLAAACSLVHKDRTSIFDLLFIPCASSLRQAPCLVQFIINRPDESQAFKDLTLLSHSYQQVLDRAPSLISIKDRQGYIRLTNQAFSLLDGPAPHEYIDRNVFELFPPDIAKDLWKNDLSVFESGQLIEAEEKVRHKDGTVHTYLTHKFPLKEVNGSITEVCAISTDITARKFYEEQAFAERARAEEASRVKSDFLANMSHEIRTPLTVIRGYAELIAKKSSGLQGPEIGWVSSIVRSSKQLEMIINDILNLAKVEAGKIEIEKGIVDLGQVIQDLKNIFNAKIEEKSIYLRFHVQGKVPAKIDTDALRLKQVLINLLGNAIKFTEKGGVDVTVKMMADLSGEPKLAFIISDTGIGLNTQQQAKLFLPFSQADNSTTRKYGGTGLGLTLSKSLAALLGGDVQLKRSEPDVGSVFLATIHPGILDEKNLVSDLPDIAFPLGSDANDMFDGRPLWGQKILLVEDAEDIQELLRYILAHQGAEVDLARNGQEALDGWRRRSYDVILMDLQMPVLDGIHAVLAMRAEGCKIPIVALTAHAFVGERERCLLAGCNEYLTKPIIIKTLTDTLRRFPGKRGPS